MSDFTSRFGKKLLDKRTEDVNNILLTTAMFASLAECFNTVVTPVLFTFSFQGLDITGTFLNLSGAFFGGLALAACGLGPRASAISDVFRGGFVAAYTSYLHMVEHSTVLHCGRPADSASTTYLVLKILGGPIFFSIGRGVGRIVFPTSTTDSSQEKSMEQRGAALAIARQVAVALIAIAMGMEFMRDGLEALVQLTIGVFMAALACYFGDQVALFGHEVIKSIDEDVTYELGDSDTNWGTISANAAALGLLVVCANSQNFLDAFSRKLPSTAGWLALTVFDKFRGSFLGALSAYGGFSEDVAVAASKRKVDAVAVNVGMNVTLSLIALAFLTHAECPFGVGNGTSPDGGVAAGKIEGLAKQIIELSSTYNNK